MLGIVSSTFIDATISYIQRIPTLAFLSSLRLAELLVIMAQFHLTAHDPNTILSPFTWDQKHLHMRARDHHVSERLLPANIEHVYERTLGGRWKKGGLKGEDE